MLGNVADRVVFQIVSECEQKVVVVRHRSIVAPPADMRTKRPHQRLIPKTGPAGPKLKFFIRVYQNRGSRVRAENCPTQIGF